MMIVRFTEVPGAPHDRGKPELFFFFLKTAQKDCTGSPNTQLYFKMIARFASEANMTFYFSNQSNIIQDKQKDLFLI